MPLNKEVGISWTDHSYQRWRGCAKVSEGCRFCWAEDIMKRFHDADDWTVANIQDNLHVYDEDPVEELDLGDEQAWIFAPSSTDPWLPWAPEAVVRDYWHALFNQEQHCFQVLTKWGPEVDNDERSPVDYPDHIMLGVTVESPRRKYRIDWLREQPAATKFISFEPLVEGIEDVNLEGIDWIIVGGESLRNPDLRREMDPEWAIRLLKIAREQDVAYFFKQHSGPYAEADRELVIGNRPTMIEEFPDVPADVPPTPTTFVKRPRQTTLADAIRPAD